MSTETTPSCPRSRAALCLAGRCAAPSCFGRGYKPEGQRHGGPGFYARTCTRCAGSGQIEEARLRKSERPQPFGASQK